jgi:hypothetical protein
VRSVDRRKSHRFYPRGKKGTGEKPTASRRRKTKSTATRRKTGHRTGGIARSSDRSSHAWCRSSADRSVFPQVASRARPTVCPIDRPTVLSRVESLVFVEQASERANRRTGCDASDKNDGDGRTNERMLRRRAGATGKPVSRSPRYGGHDDRIPNEYCRRRLWWPPAAAGDLSLPGNDMVADGRQGPQ